MAKGEGGLGTSVGTGGGSATRRHSEGTRGESMSDVVTLSAIPEQDCVSQDRIVSDREEVSGNTSLAKGS